ncbi:hypothetical protein Q3H92_00175 [Curtobacterium flaccumfaciens]|nr:hypothetical protein [Curtobacterium flaccumfaciens]
MSSPAPSRTRPSRPALLAAALAGVLLLSACSATSTASTSSGDDTAGVEHATSQIKAASVDPEFTFEGARFDMSGIAGKTIFNIPNSSAVPFITPTRPARRSPSSTARSGSSTRTRARPPSTPPASTRRSAAEPTSSCWRRASTAN